MKALKIGFQNQPLNKRTSLFCLNSKHSQKIPTASLNELVQEATRMHPLPHYHSKVVKIYYAVQYDFCPPKIALIMNRPKALHFSYKRYLQNTLRTHFKLEGVPLMLSSRKKGQKDEG